MLKETIFSFQTINGGGVHLSRDNLHFTLYSNTPDCGDGISSEKLNTYKNITNSTIFHNDACEKLGLDLGTYNNDSVIRFVS